MEHMRFLINISTVSASHESISAPPHPQQIRQPQEPTTTESHWNRGGRSLYRLTAGGNGETTCENCICNQVYDKKNKAKGNYFYSPLQALACLPKQKRSLNQRTFSCTIRATPAYIHHNPSFLDPDCAPCNSLRSKTGENPTPSHEMRADNIFTHTFLNNTKISIWEHTAARSRTIGGFTHTNDLIRRTQTFPQQYSHACSHRLSRRRQAAQTLPNPITLGMIHKEA